MKSSTIILTGYRATGKSSVGAGLAARLSLDFLDMDRILEADEGRTIKEMVDDQGWDYFRTREKSLLQELVRRGKAVIATGGGAILHQDVWPRVMSAGVVVWLTADRETICRRLRADHKTDSQRPALTDDDICREVETVLREREPLYRAGCHLRIDTASKSIRQVIAEIEDCLENNLKQPMARK